MLLEDLKSSRQDFVNFTMIQKVDFIRELLLITRASAERGGFGKFNIKLKKNDAGRILKTWKVEDMIFIDKSITGLYERRYTL